MEVEVDHNNLAVIQITDGPTVNYVKPSIDVTLFSALRIWGKGVISVILTGMGHDGREGTRAVKKLGGRSLAQSQVGCTLYGMNKSIIEAGLADRVAIAEEVAVELAAMLGYNVS